MYKFIFVDFDDTLCVHTEYLNDMYKQYLCERAEVICSNVYKNSLPNTVLISYLKERKQEGTHIVLISSANSILLGAKQVWCDTNVRGLIDSYIATSIEMTKVDVIESYLNYYHLDKSDVLFIDDSWSERHKALLAKIPCQTPQEVMLKYLNK